MVLDTMESYGFLSYSDQQTVDAQVDDTDGETTELESALHA